MRWRDWQHLREYILKEDMHACVRCGANDCVLQVDHILPKAEFPELERHADNLQTLCLRCHQNKGVEEERMLKRFELLTETEKEAAIERFKQKQREKQRYKRKLVDL